MARWHIWLMVAVTIFHIFLAEGKNHRETELRDIIHGLSRKKRFDSSVLMAHCGSLDNRCRHIPLGRCVRACVNGVVKTVCRIPHANSSVHSCLVINTPST
ncbi:uncharacterized protein LOC124281893 [Haliotis rubra]|uniref:uncharacterized protein LOC124281893 n=1 Tax=Haliotis rubra TaxID=36100 RepID=UPI001EE6065E|nr:uncharacterized protein LOC124281893 [Haliotis rubra]